jgi:hypothetical protein
MDDERDADNRQQEQDERQQIEQGKNHGNSNFCFGEVGSREKYGASQLEACFDASDSGVA